ncbi:MAG: OmpA family protein, partial [Oligoflexales bacterium]|nr:OmpA family protein [Oligoflexales bacterium]
AALKDKIKDLGNRLKKAEDGKKGKDQEIGDLKTKLADAGKDSAALKDKIKDLGNRLKKADDEGKGKDKEIGDLKTKLADAAKDNADLRGKLANNDLDLWKYQKQKKAPESDSGPRVGNLEKALSNADKLNQDLGKKVNECQTELSKVKTNDDGKDNQIKNLLATVDDIKSKNVKCAEERDKAVEKAGSIAEKNKDNVLQLSALSDKLSGARDALRAIGNERKKIASTLADDLKKAGMDVDIDDKTGKLTMRMDESFYFQHNSYNLTESAKEKLKKVIPIYTQSLFKNKEISQRISAVTITGFASPRYEGTYVNPISDNLKAFDYNLNLSLNRAREITQYILGDEVGNYPHKEELKAIVSVSGQSYMHPILKSKDKEKNSSEEKEDNTCGPYDCAKSRRVEISFMLKEWEDTAKDLRLLNNKLK